MSVCFASILFLRMPYVINHLHSAQQTKPTWLPLWPLLDFWLTTSTWPLLLHGTIILVFINEPSSVTPPPTVSSGLQGKAITAILRDSRASLTGTFWMSLLGFPTVLGAGGGHLMSSHNIHLKMLNFLSH